MLVDKRILAGGLAMLVIGIIVSIDINAATPVGTENMSESEALELILKQREAQDANTLSGILIGVGFLLVLVSFGARRRSKSGPKIVKKPDVGM